MRDHKNVLVLLYKRDRSSGDVYYCIMKRADIKDCWQFVAGGVEIGETIMEAAKRELLEETGVSEYLNFIQLDSVCSVPGYCFKKDFRINWPKTVFVVQCNAFGVEIPCEKIKLSEEHLEFRWLPYNIAYDFLRYDYDKTTLWELDQRIKDNRLNE